MKKGGAAVSDFLAGIRKASADIKIRTNRQPTKLQDQGRTSEPKFAREMASEHVFVSA